MNKVSESIWSDGKLIIPMADVQHIEKTNEYGGSVITKHTKWDCESDTWANNIWLNSAQLESFIKDWTYYRFELEGGSKGFKSPED